MFKRLLFIIGLAIFCTQVHAQWTWLNPKPSGSAGKSIAFLSEQTGFILTSTNLISTQNAGSSWETKLSLAGGNEIKFNGQVGFIVGYSGIVYQSLDSGNSWQRLNVNSTENFHSVQIVHPDTVLITGDKSLIRSYDGGKTWTSILIMSTERPSLTVNKAFFINGKVGHAASNEGTILKTKDGGQTWYVTESVNHFPSEFFTITFVNEQLGFASRAHNDILRTTDGGETWVEIQGTSDAIYDFFFVNEQVGYMAGDHGVIFKTTNGGVNWEWVSFQNGRYWNTSMLGLYFLNEETGFAVGFRGRILKTTSGGSSWSQYSFTYNDISNLYFPDGQLGYALGDHLYKTTNAGDTWEALETGLNEDYYYYKFGHFLSADTGFVVADNGYYSDDMVLKTTDGGKTWTQLTIYKYFQNANSIFFLDHQTGFITCSDGAYGGGLYKTTDGGATWNWWGTMGRGTEMHFTNDNHGLALQNGDLYTSTDGGKTWTMTYEVYGDFTDIHFVSEKVGYISAEYNTVLKTKDGGATWEELKTEYDHLHAVAFLNENIGYVSGEYGKNFKTMDGGYTWQEESIPARLTSLAITSDKTILGAGPNGVLLRRGIDYEELLLKAREATEITADAAMLNGVIASNREKVENIRFEYGEMGKFDKSVLVAPNTLEPNTSEKVKVALSNLLPNTKYWYRLKATYKGKEEVSQYMEFTTKPELSLTMGYIYQVMTDKAELWGEVVSNIEDITQIRFEYGTTDALGEQFAADPGEVKAKSSSSVKASLTQLLPNTKYYVRLKALHKGKEHVSAVQTFTTRPEYVINIFRAILKESSAELMASIVSYKGSVTDIEFEYGTTPAYGKTMQASPASVGEGWPEYVGTTLVDLDKDTVYYYRLKALQGEKPIYSAGYMFRLVGGAILQVDSTEAVSANSTTFVGKIAPQGYYVGGIQFEYGLSTDYGDSVKATPAELFGYATGTIRASVKGLIPGTTYHYRIKSYVNGQPVYSEDRTFTTAILSSITHEDELRLKVFPIPTADLLTISHERVVERIEVFDQLGRHLLLLKPKISTCTLDLSGYPAGIYYLLIHDQSQTWSRTIIKQ